MNVIKKLQLESLFKSIIELEAAMGWGLTERSILTAYKRLQQVYFKKIKESDEER